jgi:hypothetical protein
MASYYFIQGELMRNTCAESPNDIKSKPSSGPEIDYSPKTYSVRDQIMIGVKLFAVIGIILALFWLFDAK